MTMNKTLITAIATSTALAAGSAEAAVIAATTFDDTVKSAASQTMTGIDWTGDDLVAVTANTSVTTVASADDGYFTSGFGATGFAPDQNVGSEGPWAATFELTLNGTTTGTLTGISLDYQGLTNSGSNNGGNQSPEVTISVNGTTFDSVKTTPTIAGTLTFTDTAALVNGLNTIVITASNDTTTGYNLGIDNLTFTGTLVPEPSSLALLGLGGLCMMKRRRRD